MKCMKERAGAVAILRTPVRGVKVNDELSSSEKPRKTRVRLAARSHATVDGHHSTAARAQR